MGAMAPQINSPTIVYSTVYSGADQRTHQSSGSLAFVREIHRWRVNFPQKGPVTRKMFSIDDVIMENIGPIRLRPSLLSLSDTKFLWKQVIIGPANSVSPFSHKTLRKSMLIVSSRTRYETNFEYLKIDLKNLDVWIKYCLWIKWRLFSWKFDLYFTADIVVMTYYPMLSADSLIG